MRDGKRAVLVALILCIITASYFYYGYLAYLEARSAPFGEILVYQVTRSFGFNGRFVNYTEFLRYSFGEPRDGKLNITVTEPQQTYLVIISLQNYSILSVKYQGTNISLNANRGEIEDIYLPYIFNAENTTFTIIGYSFTKVGYRSITVPALGKVDAEVLVARVNGPLGQSNYTLTIYFYYDRDGLLVKSTYIWSSSGPTGYYYRNVTSVLYKIYQ
jgi:hypothetical protein